jgi:hypothetical protein
MKLINTIKIMTAVIIMAIATNPAQAAKGGNGKDKGGGGDDGGVGNSNALVYLDNDSPRIPCVESESFNNNGQVVFYGQMDLSQFPGSYNNGDICPKGMTEGIIVIQPRSNNNPQAAEMIFWYNDTLDSNETATHLLTMTGTFDERDNWPPTTGDIYSSVTLEYWEFAAENRKAQRKDCAGKYDYPGAGNQDAGPWTVTVTLVQSSSSVKICE